MFSKKKKKFFQTSTLSWNGKVSLCLEIIEIKLFLMNNHCQFGSETLFIHHCKHTHTHAPTEFLFSNFEYLFWFKIEFFIYYGQEHNDNCIARLFYSVMFSLVQFTSNGKNFNSQILFSIKFIAKFYSREFFFFFYYKKYKFTLKIFPVPVLSSLFSQNEVIIIKWHGNEPDNLHYGTTPPTTAISLLLSPPLPAPKVIFIIHFGFTNWIIAQIKLNYSPLGQQFCCCCFFLKNFHFLP